MQKFSKEQEVLLHKYYSEGKTDYDVASLMKVGRDRLRKWRHLNKVPSKSRSKGLGLSLCPSIIERRENGESFISIATSINVSHSSVIRLLKKYQKPLVKINPFSMTSEKFKTLSEKEQQKYIKEAFLYYRKKGFPYISYDYNKLMGVIKSLIRYKQDVKVDTIKHCTIGANFCEHFFSHLYKASRYDKTSSLVTWNDDGKFHRLLRNRFRYAPKFNDSAIRRGLKLLGGVSNFKPTVAKYVYQRYLVDGGTTYDFSAGYGGRLSGFLASGKGGKYIGTDPLQETCKGLRDLYNYWRENTDTTAQVNIINNCAEDFKLNPESVNLAFSCPPYFDLEKYSDDKTQSICKYPAYKEWLEKFWRPVVRNCYSMLKSSGYLIYVVGNYLNYDLKRDFEKICKSEDFVKEHELKIPMSNMFLKKKTKETFKYEKMFIYRKSLKEIISPIAGDISKIIEIVRDYYREGIMGFLPVQVYYKARENGNILVCKESGKIKGFIVFKFLKRSNKYRIIQIACQKDSLRRGIGSSMLLEVIKKNYPIILDVKKENSGAINFYICKGFVQVSEKNDILEFEKDI